MRRCAVGSVCGEALAKNDCVSADMEVKRGSAVSNASTSVKRIEQSVDHLLDFIRRAGSSETKRRW